MVSVIIPTLWRSPGTLKLIEELLQWRLLHELIVIDNNPKDRPSSEIWSHCILLEQSENIYVNPAWNLGAKTASGSVLAICNDDIFFNADALNPYVDQLSRNEIMGLHADSILNAASINTNTIEPGFNIGLGWGCLMLVKRQSFIPIPHEIRIWYGDDWLIHSIGKKTSMRFAVQGTLSVSAGDETFNPVKEQDKVFYDRYIWNPLYRGLRVLSKKGFHFPFQLLLSRIT